MEQTQPTQISSTVPVTSDTRWCQRNRTVRPTYTVAVENGGRPNRAARRKAKRAGRLRLTKRIVTKSNGKQYVGNICVSGRGKLDAHTYIKRVLETHAMRMTKLLANHKVGA